MTAGWTGGLYVHVPFCSTVCPYCDFAVVAGASGRHDAYLAALVDEARTLGDAEPGFAATSVFVGGGTPTFVDPHALASSMSALGEHLEIPADVEFTVECNPEDVEASRLEVLFAGRAARASIGAQSFDPAVLRALGRAHEPAANGAAIDAARRAGARSVSVDLIYGTPVEGDASWERTVGSAVTLGADHVSCYALTIEAGTPFARRGVEPDEDALAARFEIACDVLGAAGFEHYEVSNWARPGHRSAHNLTYWTQGDYLGLGLGAHSHRAGHRWWNTRSLNDYLASPARARTGEERLDDAERAEEWVMLRLRLTEGIDLGEAAARLGRALPVEAVIDAGLGSLHEGVFRLNRRGLLLGNRVAEMLAA